MVSVMGPVLGRLEPPQDQMEVIKFQCRRQDREVKGRGLIRAGLCPRKEIQGNLTMSGTERDPLSIAIAIPSVIIQVSVTLMLEVSASCHGISGTLVDHCIHVQFLRDQLNLGRPIIYLALTHLADPSNQELTYTKA